MSASADSEHKRVDSNSFESILQIKAISVWMAVVIIEVVAPDVDVNDNDDGSDEKAWTWLEEAVDTLLKLWGLIFNIE